MSEQTNLAEMQDLGFDTVPTVVVDGRAFQAFPDEVLKRELGIPIESNSLEIALKHLETSAQILAITADVVAALPQSLWSVRLVDNRDRGLGQWSWHIFQFAVECVEGIEGGVLEWEDVRRLAERQYWTDEETYLEFESIARYGKAVVERLSHWSRSVDDDLLSQEMESPWGILSGYGLISHLERHSAIHLRQIVDFVKARVPAYEAFPPVEFMETIPSYGSLKQD
ncbi:MAG: hypothetical protein GEU78_16650 [Actinobacteria bacterium]|nr:hypothetical protein [Actinomycetota bacterium]